MTSNTEVSQESDAQCYVVYFQILDGEGEDGSVELLVRARCRWLYVSLDPSDLGAGKGSKACSLLLAEFETLRERAILAKQQREAELIGQAHDEATDDRQTEHANKKRHVDSLDDKSASGDKTQSQSPQPETTPPSSDEDDAERALQNWMLAPLISIFENNGMTKTKSGKEQSLSLTEWYQVPLSFYSLHSSSSAAGKLEAAERTDVDEQDFRRRHLQNTLSLPKNLRNAAPWYNPDDITVLHESEDIHMHIHPTLVKIKRQDNSCDDAEVPSHFLKLVPSGHGTRHSIERELFMLKKLKDLCAKGSYGTGDLRFPSLQGLVAPPTTKKSHATIIGFLLELIPGPRPLTEYTSEDVPQEKRNRWASQSRAMVDCLHHNNLTWGDAKSDNFLVDRNDSLWIIDFGGGFTEGWVREENLETKDGDQEGIEKIKIALTDEADKVKGEKIRAREKEEQHVCKKRKR